jgi:ribonuclease HI
MFLNFPYSNTPIVAFTDGSCQGNPGPCGYGAVLYPGDNEGISLKRPVAQRGSILLAELVAILMVLEHCIAALNDFLCRLTALIILL